MESIDVRLLILLIFMISCFLCESVCTFDGEDKGLCSSMYSGSQSYDRLTKVEKMFSWIRSNGGYVHPSIEPFVKNYGELGIRAKEDLPRNIILATVPDKCLINTRNAENDPIIGESIKNLNLDYTIHEERSIAISLFMIYHKFVLQEKSFFYPYLDSLPDDLPSLWMETEKNIQLLQKFGSPVHFPISESISQTRKDSLRIPELIKSDDILSKEFEALEDIDGKSFWAFVIVLNRAFLTGKTKERKPISVEASQSRMIPFFDMLDSSGGGMIEIGLNDDRNLEGKIIIEARQNEEIFHQYHDNYPNYKLLSHYGFADEKNPNDVILFAGLSNGVTVLHTLSFTRLVNQVDQLNESKAKKLKELLEERLHYFDVSGIEEYDSSDQVAKFLKLEKKELDKCLQHVNKFLYQLS